MSYVKANSKLKIANYPLPREVRDTPVINRQLKQDVSGTIDSYLECVENPTESGVKQAVRDMLKYKYPSIKQLPVYLDYRLGNGWSSMRG